MTTSQFLSFNTENPLLRAFCVDLHRRNENSYVLAGELQGRYPLPVLPLDIWNILSLEIIQEHDDFNQLFVIFQGRKQLCIDIQVSDLLKAESLSEYFRGLKVELISDEVVLVLLWDVAPSAQAILDVVTRLTLGVDVHGKTLGTVGMVIGRQLVSLGVGSGATGGAAIHGFGNKFDLTPFICIKTMLHWELKPDIIMLKTGSTPLFPSLHPDELHQLISLAKHSEDIQLVAPVPSILIRDTVTIKEIEFSDTEESANSWKCLCGSLNPNDQIQCINCGNRREFEGIHAHHTSSETCPQCQAFKSQLDTSKTCAACGTKNRSTARICKSCFVAFAGGLNTGEWTCSTCNMTNSGNRLYCVGCFASKNKELDGQWTCDHCQTSNLKGLSRCKNCLLKPGAIISAAKWTCRRCHFSNTEDSVTCRACGGTKDMAISVTEINQSDYWTCLSCKGLNLPEKNRCRKCGSLRRMERVTTEIVEMEEEVKTCLNCRRTVQGRSSFCETCLKTEMKPTWTCDYCDTVNSGGYCTKCFRRPSHK